MSDEEVVSVGAYDNLVRIHSDECKRSIELVVENAGLKFDIRQLKEQIRQLEEDTKPKPPTD